MLNKSWIFLLLVLALLSGAAACRGKAVETPPQAGSTVRRVWAGGMERSYDLYIPPGFSRARPVPVVFVFHGWTQSSADMVASAGFDPVAQEHGFLVVYPRGKYASWNAGYCCGEAARQKVDDVAFVRAILVDISTFAAVDEKRVYASGVSNGAFFVYRLACEMSGTFAAIAPMAGVQIYAPCEPGQPVSVLHLHGLADTVVPYAGGRGDVGALIDFPPGEQFPPVEEGIAAWVKLDGCRGAPQVEQSGPSTHITYAACREGAAVELYQVEGLGHGFPPGNDTQVAEKVWAFFEAHAKP